MGEHTQNKRILKDNNYYKLIEESDFNGDSYCISETYTAFFSIINKLAFSQKLIFVTNSPEEIKLVNASSLGRYEERKLEIQFSPISLGEKKFELYIESPRILKQRLLEKNFCVQEKPGLNVEGYIKKNLPKRISVGQTAEVVFEFKNKGNCPVTDVLIKVT
jgi:hypothetical protein